MPLRRVAVLGGNDSAAPEEYLAAVNVLGRLLAQQSIGLLHQHGLRGSAAALVAAFRAAGGHAAVVAATDFTGADGLLVLPGSTLILNQLFSRYLAGPAADQLPCGLLNTQDYFSGLLKATADEVVEQFVREIQRGRLIVERDPAELLRAMMEFRPPETRRQLA